jgi:ubiquitin C-terminal hydrolase
VISVVPKLALALFHPLLSFPKSLVNRKSYERESPANLEDVEAQCVFNNALTCIIREGRARGDWCDEVAAKTLVAA